nr:transmembrane protein [Ipomoea batatas]
MSDSDSTSVLFAKRPLIRGRVSAYAFLEAYRIVFSNFLFFLFSLYLSTLASRSIPFHCEPPLESTLPAPMFRFGESGVVGSEVGSCEIDLQMFFLGYDWSGRNRVLKIEEVVGVEEREFRGFHPGGGVFRQLGGDRSGRIPGIRGEILMGEVRGVGIVNRNQKSRGGGLDHRLRRVVERRHGDALVALSQRVSRVDIAVTRDT